MTTTIADTFRDPTGAGIGGVVVRATLVAASEVLTGGGAIIREAEVTTASNGTWALTLTPISQLAVSTGAYYLITADGHRWTIDVPDTGTHALDDVQIEPGPLPATGATAAALTTETTAREAGDALTQRIVVPPDGLAWYQGTDPFDAALVAIAVDGDLFTYVPSHAQAGETYRRGGGTWTFVTLLPALPASVSTVIHKFA